MTYEKDNLFSSIIFYLIINKLKKKENKLFLNI